MKMEMNSKRISVAGTLHFLSIHIASFFFSYYYFFYALFLCAHFYHYLHDTHEQLFAVLIA